MIPFGEAAGHDELLIKPFLLRHVEDALDGLDLGRLDKSAGIDDQDIRFFGIGRHPAAARQKRRGQQLGIDLILGTSQRIDIDCLTHYCSGSSPAPPAL